MKNCVCMHLPYVVLCFIDSWFIYIYVHVHVHVCQPWYGSNPLVLRWIRVILSVFFLALWRRLRSVRAVVHTTGVKRKTWNSSMCGCCCWWFCVWLWSDVFSQVHNIMYIRTHAWPSIVERTCLFRQVALFVNTAFKERRFSQML